jgi:hypothetical protein
VGWFTFLIGGGIFALVNGAFGITFGTTGFFNGGGGIDFVGKF